MGLDAVCPEILLQEDEFRFIGGITVGMADNRLFGGICVVTAVVDPVYVHHGHIVTPLDFVIQRYDLAAVVPPVFLAKWVGGFTLQDGDFPIWKFPK